MNFFCLLQIPGKHLPPSHATVNSGSKKVWANYWLSPFSFVLFFIVFRCLCLDVPLFSKSKREHSDSRFSHISFIRFPLSSISVLIKTSTEWQYSGSIFVKIFKFENIFECLAAAFNSSAHRSVQHILSNSNYFFESDYHDCWRFEYFRGRALTVLKKN